VSPPTIPPTKVCDALKTVGVQLQPVIFETHGAMDAKSLKTINSICKRANVLKGYKVRDFRRNCFEELGTALFLGLYERALNRATLYGNQAETRPGSAFTNLDLNVATGTEGDGESKVSSEEVETIQTISGSRQWSINEEERRKAQKLIQSIRRQKARQDSSSSDRPNQPASRSGSSLARRVSNSTQDERSGNGLATHPPTAVQETTN